MSENLKHPAILLPDQKNFDVAYGQALKLASEKLATATDFEELCRRSGSLLVSENNHPAIQLNYLNNQYLISLPDVTISQARNQSTVEIRDKILILHYLLTSSGKALSGDLISFKELGEGLAYYPTFAQRSIRPLITYFGSHPEKMLSSAAAIGGVKSSFGNFSVTIPAFDKVPITLVIWQGDEEFPPDANILFDRLTLDYLPMEDSIVLCQTIVWKMIKYSQAR
jgi:hypothetical protein